MRRHLALVALLLGLLAVAAPSTFAAGPKQKDNDTHVQLLASTTSTATSRRRARR